MEIRYCVKKYCGKELSKRQRLYCSNSCKLSDPKNIADRTKKKTPQDKTKMLKCIHTGKTFKDISNYSGVITKHLKSLKIPMSNWESNFVLLDNPKSKAPVYRCRYCSWETSDIENKSGCITVHLQTKHEVSPTLHIERYPEDSNIWSYTHSQDLREHFLSKDYDSYIECLECGTKMKRITGTHLEKHNMSMEDYRTKYDIDKLSSKKYLEFLKKHREESFHPKGVSYTSKAQIEIFEFIKNTGVEASLEDRKLLYPYEVDIIIHEKKVAIEYNGLYWHSERGGKKLKDYHIKKLEICESKGYRLIQIWEDEWLHKKDIVKSKILSILGLQGNRIFARKCLIREIDSQQKSVFLKNNHIQGDDICSRQFGLFYDHSMVAVMTFTLPRRALGRNTNSGKEMELSRYATSIRVVGGFSKMIKHCIRVLGVEKIYTYADRRWSSNINDTVYSKNGFIKVSTTKPNYWYILNGRDRRHRFNFNKRFIVEKMGGDPNLTEVENMFRMGYDRIWDCGSIKYELLTRL